MINDKTSNEQLKESMTQQEINSIKIKNNKTKGSRVTKGLDTSVKVGKKAWRALEKM